MTEISLKLYFDGKYLPLKAADAAY